MFIQNVLHTLDRFFFFTTSINGNLLRNFIELLFFSFIVYMVVSEYSRTKQDEMKYLTYGFGSLALGKLIACLLFWYHLFGKVNLNLSRSMIPLIDHAAELLGLFMLANAFLFPFFKKKSNMFKGFIKYQSMAVLGSIGVVSLLWVFFVFWKIDSVGYGEFIGNRILLIMKMFFLLLPALYYLMIIESKYRYRINIAIAFFVYLLTPFFTLVNSLFFGGQNTLLQGIIAPFPVISVLMFARIIYLKLADKATLQEKLLESEKKFKHAQEINLMKDEFVSTVSHELRTPLTSMKLYLSLLRDGELGKVSGEQKKAVTIVCDESDRLANLINDILDLSKLEAKKVQLYFEDVDLTDLITSNTYFKMAEEKKIEVVTDISAQFVIKTDVAKFKQIFVNLFSNALKFTPKGGKITLAFRKRCEGWSFEISDTGCGIEKEKIPRLFDKFYQVDGHLTRTTGGTGLGLAIVYNLVKLFGGKINVTSKVGEGTKFSMFFPHIDS